jgi:hypothetical protein
MAARESQYITASRHDTSTASSMSASAVPYLHFFIASCWTPMYSLFLTFILLFCFSYFHRPLSLRILGFKVANLGISVLLSLGEALCLTSGCSLGGARRYTGKLRVERAGILYRGSLRCFVRQHVAHDKSTVYLQPPLRTKRMSTENVLKLYAMLLPKCQSVYIARLQKRQALVLPQDRYDFNDLSRSDIKPRPCTPILQP